MRALLRVAGTDQVDVFLLRLVCEECGKAAGSPGCKPHAHSYGGPRLKGIWYHAGGRKDVQD